MRIYSAMLVYVQLVIYVFCKHLNLVNKNIFQEKSNIFQKKAKKKMSSQSTFLVLQRPTNPVDDSHGRTDEDYMHICALLQI
jgi:hypothetical protein